METLVLLISLLLLHFVWRRMVDFWNEWHGAFSRWRRGQPLRASEMRSDEFQAEIARRDLRREELKRLHLRDSRQILDPTFRREFEELGLAAEIYADVIAASGHCCAACGRDFSQRRRKGMLHVDHIRPRKLFPHLIYVRSNLQVLCRSCNSHKSAYDGDDWRAVVADRRRATARRKRIERAKSRQS